jgi:hypothetical protein
VNHRRPIAALTALLLASFAVRAQDVPNEPPVPPDVRWAEVLVVDAETGKPVPGLEVQWTDDRVLQWPLPSIDAPLVQPPPKRFEPFRRRGVTDERGRVRVHYGNHALVQVMTPTMRGTQFVGAPETMPPSADGLVRLVLEPYVPWPVRAVDPTGKPVPNVQVTLGVADSASASVLASAITGADGAAELAIPKAVFSASSEPPMLRVTAQRAGREEPPLLVPAGELAKPLSVAVPAVGSVRVVVRAAGQPLVGGGHVDLQLQRESGLHPLGTWPLAADGTALCDGVPLGGELIVRLRLDSLGVEQAIEGPAADAPAMATFELEAMPFTVRGTLLGVDGAPLAGGHASAQALGGGQAWNGSLTIGDDGRFVWRLAEAQFAPDRLDSLLLSLSGRGGVPWRCERRDLAVVAGDNDLGTLRMTAPPLLLRARVLVDGEPGLLTTGLVVETALPGTEGDASGWHAARNFQFEPRWGGFLLWGEAPKLRHRVRVAAPGLIAAGTTEFEPGGELTLELQRALPLVVRTVLPDGLEVDALRAELVPERGEPQPASARFFGLPEKTNGAEAVRELRFAGVPRGRYQLHVGPAGWGEPAVVVRDVELPLPPEGDSRLDGLDLRPHVRMVRVRVARPPRPRGSRDLAAVFVDAPTLPSDEWCGFPVVNGTARVALPLRPVELLVAAVGCRPQTLRAVRGDAQVELMAWPRLTVDLQGVPELPPGLQAVIVCRAAEPKEQVRALFRVGAERGALRELLETAPPTMHVDGDGDLPALAAPAPCSLLLMAPWGERLLDDVTPRQLPAGPGRVRLQVDAAAAAKAVAELIAARPADDR